MFDFEDIPEDLGGASEFVESIVDTVEACGRVVCKEVEEEWVVPGDGSSLRCGELGVRVARAAAGSSQPRRYCVLFVPGMPQKEFGSARCTDELPSAILKKCWELGLPTVRFDYTGYGQSKGKAPDPDDAQANAEYGPRMRSDAAGMVTRVLEDYEQLIVVCFSAGNENVAQALHDVHKEDRIAAYININMGTRAMLLQTTDVNAIQALQRKGAKALLKPAMLAALDALQTVGPLFIVGNDDWMTPVDDITNICHGWAHSFVEVVPGKHALEGYEDLAADKIKVFLSKKIQSIIR